MDEIDDETRERMELGRGLARQLGRSRARLALADRAAGVFRFELVAHRSLGSTAFRVLMFAVIAVNVVVGGVFYTLGAWPVTAFCGLDVLLVWLAFRANYTSGRCAETIEISPAALKLTRTHPAGPRETFTFHPYWVRVRLQEGTDGRNALTLASHGRAMRFAAFLSDDERRDFAEHLTGALLSARGARPAGETS